MSPDRPGLLARIGGVFLQFGIHLLNAKIATLGERVEDIFFISDKHGQPLTDITLCRELQDEICRQLDEKVESDTNGIY
jgi:[protein-PII] uridylyltransferase